MVNVSESDLQSKSRQPRERDEGGLVSKRSFGSEHQCLSGGSYRCRSPRTGHPLAAKCRDCGGRWATRSGLYAVLAWRADGRYQLTEATHTYTARPVAQRNADRLNNDPDQTCQRGYVVRFLSVHPNEKVTS